MLSIQDLRHKKEEIISLLQKRNHDFTAVINQVTDLDVAIRKHKAQLDQILAESNQLAKQIGQLFSQAKQEEAELLKKKTVSLKEESRALSQDLEAKNNELKNLMVTIPNVPNQIVPAGNSDADNQIISENKGFISDLESKKPHWELAEQYQIIDFELGAKITGAGFPVYQGKGAKLQRALINFFLDRAAQEGYLEVLPPHMVNSASAFATGQLPDKDGQMYHVTEDELFLIPTAEVPVTNIFRDCIVKPSDLPLKRVAYSPCFRREAGSYGKHVRGLNRLHQFDKVEIVQVVHPSKSYQTLEQMVSYVCELLKELSLPYRVVRLCGGDLSFTSALTYDLEVYSSAQDRWLEVSSISNFEAYQSHRLKLRFKEDQASVFAHTLNGSALALPRILASILENYQTKEGIIIPDCLQSYTGFDKIN